MQNNDYTKAMVKLFDDIEIKENPNFFKKSLKSLNYFNIKYIKNPDRKWFQFWKPKKIIEPGEDVEIDIVR